MFGINFMDRTWRIVKDILFIALGVVLMVKGGFFPFLLGTLAMIWYGKNLLMMVAVARIEKQARKAVDANNNKADVSRPKSPEGKIQVTDLTQAREVDFEKE